MTVIDSGYVTCTEASNPRQLMPSRKPAITLITPPVSLEERYGRLSGAGNTLPSLGLLSLGSCLRKAGYPVTVIDACSKGLPQKKTIEYVISAGPKYVCISATTLTIHSAVQVAETIKAIDPKITTVIGGPHLTAVPEKTMELFSCLDIGVIGEGEETIIELIKNLEDDTGLSNIPGIIYRRDNDLVKTGPRPFIKNLDDIPFPAWDLLDDFPKSYRPPPFRFKSLPAAYIVTSRGCPYQCIFCDRSVFGNRCRTHSAEYILALMEYLFKRFGIREILLEDDTFVTFRKRLIEICEGILRKGLKIGWSCLGRADAVDLEILNLMKKSGCWHISYGIETGDPKVMDFIGKKISLEKIEQAVHWTKEAGLMAKGFFILGHPIDTHESIQKTIEFALKIPLDDISVAMLTPFPGSMVYEIASQYGEFDEDWQKMNLLDVVFIPKGITKTELKNYSRQMIRKFYLRPNRIMNYSMRIFRNPKNLPIYIKGITSVLKDIGRHE